MPIYHNPTSHDFPLALNLIIPLIYRQQERVVVIWTIDLPGLHAIDRACTTAATTLQPHFEFVLQSLYMLLFLFLHRLRL